MLGAAYREVNLGKEVEFEACVCHARALPAFPAYALQIEEVPHKHGVAAEPVALRYALMLPVLWAFL